MKPVSELTDQELNEWVWKRIMPELSCLKDGLSRERPVVFIKIRPGCSETQFFEPCNNLNHAYLMEEKIWEMQKYLFYIEQLSVTSGAAIHEDYMEPITYKGKWLLLHASARQRVEAAYLTLNPEKELKIEK